MDTGIISSRYSTALLKYVKERGSGPEVCSQVSALEAALVEIPDLERMISDEIAVDDKKKMALLEAALGEPMEKDLKKFLLLLLKNGRMPYARLIFHHFVDAFNRDSGIRFAHLISATPPDESLIRALEDLVREKTGCEAIIDTIVDPSLIGGFIFDIDDYMIDASVSRQLELIKRQFIERNRRIV